MGLWGWKIIPIPTSYTHGDPIPTAALLNTATGHTSVFMSRIFVKYRKNNVFVEIVRCDFSIFSAVMQHVRYVYLDDAKPLQLDGSTSGPRSVRIIGAGADLRFLGRHECHESRTQVHNTWWQVPVLSATSTVTLPAAGRQLINLSLYGSS